MPTGLTIFLTLMRTSFGGLSISLMAKNRASSKRVIVSGIKGSASPTKIRQGYYTQCRWLLHSACTSSSYRREVTRRSTSLNNFIVTTSGILHAIKVKVSLVLRQYLRHPLVAFLFGQQTLPPVANAILLKSFFHINTHYSYIASLFFFLSALKSQQKPSQL